MFLFRENEKERLNSFLQSNTKKALAIYGRRRVGKTELLLEFMRTSGKDKGIYFQCTSQNYDICLNDFIKTLLIYFPDETIFNSFHTFKDTFTYLSMLEHKYPIIIIDEFPFLCKKKSDATTEFQWIIDHGLNGLKLILSGSNRSFMKKQISNQKEPLYGRFDEILEIKPFTFQEILNIYPNFDDAIKIYSTTGGIAQYVTFYQEYNSVEVGIHKLFFETNGRLFQEANNLLQQEFNEISTYTSILRAIGNGEKNSAQISKKSNIELKSISVYLKKLIEIDIIKIVDNPLSSKKKDRRYKISDLYFRFHYSFIEPNVSIITSLGFQSSQYVLNNQYSEYLGYVYEEIIRQNCFYYALNKKLPFMPITVGKWWGNIQKDGAWIESEIDLIAYNNDSIVFGECKYKSKAAGLKELDNLKLKSQFVNSQGRKVYYLIASKSGFTDELKSVLSDDIILIKTY